VAQKDELSSFAQSIFRKSFWLGAGEWEMGNVYTYMFFQRALFQFEMGLKSTVIFA